MEPFCPAGPSGSRRPPAGPRPPRRDASSCPRRPTTTPRSGGSSRTRPGPRRCSTSPGSGRSPSSGSIASSSTTDPGSSYGDLGGGSLLVRPPLARPPPAGGRAGGAVPRRAGGPLSIRPRPPTAGGARAARHLLPAPGAVRRPLRPGRSCSASGSWRCPPPIPSGTRAWRNAPSSSGCTTRGTRGVVMRSSRPERRRRPKR